MRPTAFVARMTFAAERIRALAGALAERANVPAELAWEAAEQTLEALQAYAHGRAPAKLLRTGDGPVVIQGDELAHLSAIAWFRRAVDQARRLREVHDQRRR